ncbi:MAG TPA: zinc-binding dehydrogenase [Polyangiaceae bacterium]|nr:zinc-binding dehydrogenase [Polyangiaceae bacterium]
MSVGIRSMRAARIVGPRRVEVQSCPVKDPGPSQVRFKVEGCGVCASNLGPWFGLPWTQYPFAPGQSGHEAWGVVEDVGKNVRTLRPGSRIAAVSYDSFAEYDVVDESAAVELPEEFADKPFPGEPLGCAMNVFERSNVQEGDIVAIVGVGFLGGILTRLFSNMGARVIAISRRHDSLALARQMGATELIPMENHGEIIQRVQDLTGGKFCDRVVEATGKQWPLDLAAELTRTRGRLMIAGYHQDGPRQVNMQLWNWRGLDVVNAHERDTAVYIKGIRSAIRAVASHELDPTPFYTHRYGLEQLGEALDATDARPSGFVKALVAP